MAGRHGGRRWRRLSHSKRALGLRDEGEFEVYHVYILRSIPRGTLYVGTTRDVEKRLRQHNAGAGKSTAPYRPFELVHTEAYATLAAARKREWYLKCTPSGGKEKSALAAARPRTLDPGA